MPTYEYRCPKGHEFETFQKMSDPPEAECPECGAAAERLLSTGAGLIFKGSGFYITDYRGESYKKAAEAEKGGGGSEGSKKSGESNTTSGSDKDGGGKTTDSGAGGAKSETSSSKSGKKPGSSGSGGD